MRRMRPGQSDLNTAPGHGAVMFMMKSIYYCQRCKSTRRARTGEFVVCRCGEPMIEQVAFVNKGQGANDGQEQTEDLLADGIE